MIEWLLRGPISKLRWYHPKLLSQWCICTHIYIERTPLCRAYIYWIIASTLKNESKRLQHIRGTQSPRFLNSDPSKQGVANKFMYIFSNLVSCKILQKKANFLPCKNIPTSISKALPQNVTSFVSAVDHLYTITLHRHWVIFGTSPEASDVHKRAGDLSILTSKRLWFKRFHVVFFDIFLDAWCSFTFGYWQTSRNS